MGQDFLDITVCNNIIKKSMSNPQIIVDFADLLYDQEVVAHFM